MEKVYLSAQGGGIRGINQCTLLTFIEIVLKELTGEDKSIADYCDGFAGCSVGSIVATLLALGKNFEGEDKHIKASEILQLLYDDGQKIFKRHICSCFGMLRSKYTNKKLEEILDDKFDEIYGYRPKLSDVSKPLLVNSADVDTNKIVLFKSENAKKRQVSDYYLDDVILASTAAPSYFPSHIMWNTIGTKRLNCTDGGITGHNNPSLLLKNEIARWNTDSTPAMILNVGTGVKRVNEERINIKQKSGILTWPFSKFFSTILNVPSDATDYSVRTDNTVKYINLTSELVYSDSAMDNTNKYNMRALIEDAVRYVNDNFKSFMEIVAAICSAKGIEMKEISKNVVINEFYKVFEY